MKKKIIITIITLAILVSSGGVYAFNRMQGQKLPEGTVCEVVTDQGTEPQSMDASDKENGKVPPPENMTEESTADTEVSELCVYICGQVENPGIYDLTTGCRIADAVEAAGGFSETAARDYLNLAETVSDGMMIKVPSAEEVKNGEITSAASSGCVSGTGEKKTSAGDSQVNINTATKEELMTLSGIGESRAQDIIDYRTSNGRFEKIEDIMKISGIKEAAFKKIRDRISV